MATKPRGVAKTRARSSQGPGNVSPAIPPVAPGGDPVPGDQTHDAEADADHDLEGDVDDARIGLVLGRPLVQPEHDRVRIVVGKQAEQTRNLDGVARLPRSRSGQPPMLNPRAGLGLKQPLQRRELRRLVLGHPARADIAADRLQRREDPGQGHRDRQPGAVIGVVAPAQHAPGVDPGHAKTGGDVRRQHHVQ